MDAMVNYVKYLLLHEKKRGKREGPRIAYGPFTCVKRKEKKRGKGSRA